MLWLPTATGTSWVSVAPAASLLQVDGLAGYLRLGLAVALLAGAAAAVSFAAGLGYARAQLLAAVRAAVQLALVGLLITAVLRSWWTTAVFILLMVAVASVTAGRRLVPEGRWLLAAIPVTLAALPVAFALLLSGLVPLAPISLVPVFGILIGGAMTATTLAGRRTLDALRTRHGEMEAGLSLGLLAREARLLVARDDAALALVPGLDQTRTVGLVTLPGAFVGMLLGGASPVEAAAVQLLVLAALLLVACIATATTVELIGRDILR